MEDGQAKEQWSTVWTHAHDIGATAFDAREAPPVVYVNREAFPWLRHGDCLAIHANGGAGDGASQPTLVLVHRVKDVETDAYPSKLRALPLSIDQTIAQHHEIVPRSEVLLRRITEVEAQTDHRADYVEFLFKNQYIGRSDMFRVKQSLVGKSIYQAQQLTFLGCIQAKVRAIYRAGTQCPSAFVTDKTRFIFRSESAKYFIFLQVCSELWTFDEDGEMYVEKAIDGFLPDLFSRWKRAETNHVISIVLFSRVMYDADDETDHTDFSKDSQGRYYRDFYKVVVDTETSPEWAEVSPALRAALKTFRQEALFPAHDSEAKRGRLSYASEGNMLAAVNMALNPFGDHYIDRDLLRTGLSMVVITPGTCHFWVNKDLLQLTIDRMTDHGIALDVVALTKMPLHTVPLFRFFPNDLNDLVQERSAVFAMPPWIDASFYAESRDMDPEKSRHGSTFQSRCRMPKIQMMGLMDHKVTPSPIPYLPFPGSTERLREAHRHHDECLFTALDGQKDAAPLYGTTAPALPLSSHSRKTERANLVMKPRTGVTAEEMEKAKESSVNLLRKVTGGKASAIEARVQRVIVQADIGVEAWKGLSAALAIDPSEPAGDNDHTIRTSKETPPQALADVKASADKLLADLQERMPLLNPCNPTVSRIIHTTKQARRWQHIFPKSFDHQKIKWKSLTTPASLPLTADFRLDELDIPGKYVSTSAHVRLRKDDLDGSDPGAVLSIDDMLQSMILHRIAQGFQLCPQPDIELALLSMGDEIHKLQILRPDKNAINVTRYLKASARENLAFHYQCSVWPKHAQGFQKVATTFPASDFARYQWQHLDQVAAGHDHVIFSTLRYWRTRFLLVPADKSVKVGLLAQVIGPPPLSSSSASQLPANLDEEEVRLEGIRKFEDLFRKAVYQDSATARQDIKIEFDTLDPAAYVTQMLTRNDATSSIQGMSGTRLKLTPDSSLDEFAGAILDRRTGVPMEDRRWHFRTYEDAFIGSDFVDWLLRHVNLPETSVQEATLLASKLMKQGLFEHCTRRHGFLDGHYFYRMGSRYLPSRQPRGWFRRLRDTSRSRSGSVAVDRRRSSPSPRRQAGSQMPRPAAQKPTIELSRAVKINVDPLARSDRLELATLHYDTVCNPDNCYHFRLEWLGTTARFIEEILVSWGRWADRYGLRLVEVPTHQILDVPLDNPFQAPVLLKLALDPPSFDQLSFIPHPDIEPLLYFETRLLRHFRFLLDVEADDHFPAASEADILWSYARTPFQYSQYIHRTGTLFAQVLPPVQVEATETSAARTVSSGGFLILDNRLPAAGSHIAGAALNKAQQHQADMNATRLRAELTAFCNDAQMLSQFWQQCIDAMPRAVD